MTERQERMGLQFAMFNCHVNDARARADAEFEAIFGSEMFDSVIAPIHEKGIMSIFDKAPDPHTMAYAVLVTTFVNEGRG